MKRTADLQISENRYKRISIWDIFKAYQEAQAVGYRYDIKQYYIEHFKGHLFSTHTDTSKKKPLSLCNKKPYNKSFFKYYPNQAPQESDDTVQHELLKEIIRDIDKLVLVYNSQKIVLYIDKNEIEYRFSANGNQYRADIFFEFYKSEPEEYLYKWNGRLYFEIKHKHAVDNKKQTDCQLERIAMVEYSISKYYIKMIEKMCTEEDELRIYNYIKNALCQCIYVKILSNPEPKHYSQLLIAQDEINNLKNTHIKYGEQLESLKKENYELDKSLRNSIEENKKLQEYINQVKSKKLLSFLFKIFRIE